MSEEIWKDQVNSSAIDVLNKIKDNIIEFLIEDGEASTDVYNDYDDGDSCVYELCNPNITTLFEAANLLKELNEYKETDSGIWSGLEPIDAVKSQAHYTYLNAVVYHMQYLIKKINNQVRDLDSYPEHSKAECEVIIKEWL